MKSISVIDALLEALKIANRENIKANSVIINKNFVKTPDLHMIGGVLPPMICGLEMTLTADELPENYSFAVLEAGKTEREKLVEVTENKTAKEIYLWLKEHTFESSIIETYFRERFGVSVD